MPRLPMTLRRGLLIQQSWVVDSDPERPATAIGSDDVRVTVRHLTDGYRQALMYPPRELVPVIGVVLDPKPTRSRAAVALASRAGVTA